MSINKQEDLLTKLNPTDDPAGGKDSIKTGDNIFNKVETKTTEDLSNKNEDTKLEAKTSDIESKPDLDKWSKDNLYKEVQKLRDEAKQTRLKSKDAVEKIKENTDSELEAYKLKLEEALKYKAEIEDLKQKEADKKRNLDEKLTDREERLIKLQLELDAQAAEHKNKITTLQDELEDYRLDKQAENKLYKEKLDNELASIPEQFRETANLVAKGAGSTRDAYLEITKAKANKMFEQKEIIVNHQVPDAKTGARSSKERLDEVAKSKRAGMSSQDLIGGALKSIRSGEQNSAFTPKK